MWRCCLVLVAPVALGLPSDCGDGCGLEDAAGMLSLSRRESLKGLERVRAGINFTCGESCGILGGVCANPPEQCLLRRTIAADEHPVCHCQVERPSRYSALQRTVAPAASKLRETAFIMTHDSGTGFIGRFDLKVRLGQAQTINLVEQLNCGARALDIRLMIKEGEAGHFYFHHGEGFFSWASDGTGETLQGEWPKLSRWAHDHPDELVLLVVSHCAQSHGFGRWSGSTCSEEQWTKEFRSLALPFETNCETLSSMNLKEALQRSQLVGGGHILGIDGQCINDNWDSSVTSFEGVRPYVEKTMERMRAGEGGKTLFQVQSFMQQRLVPMDSSLNHEILAWITNSSLYEDVNLLEINLMCAHGASMATALGYSVSAEDYQTCRTGCLQACERHGACEQL